jgi:peroxiredoxin
VGGKEFQLSAYRGKVVLLDFFGDWCPHCTAMYAHERKLTEDYRERPFVILGVNTDSPDTLRELCNDKKVTWRCWSDGREGPIAREWQVDGLPTLYLLDQEGVIRQTFTGRPEEKALERAIGDLVEKAEKAKPRTPDPGK